MEMNLRYGWYPGAHTVFQNIQPSLLAYAFRRNQGGAVETASATQFVNYAFKNGISGFVSGNVSSELLAGPLPLGPGVVVPAGKHTYAAGTFFISSPPGTNLRSSLSFENGEFYDGRRTAVTVSPTATLSKHLEITASYQANRIRFPGRSQTLDADIARVRALLALNTRLSASGFVQYNRATDAVVSNVRFRFHMNEGRDLFIVYNEQLNVDRLERDPIPPLSQERALLVKMVYMFTP
jgi:hypothetical protein